jgi:hypothetical protein
LKPLKTGKAEQGCKAASDRLFRLLRQRAKLTRERNELTLPGYAILDAVRAVPVPEDSTEARWDFVAPTPNDKQACSKR